MSARTAVRLAWGSLVASIALTASGLALIGLTLATGVQIPDSFGFPGFSALFSVSFGLVGAVVAARRAGGLIGWLFCVAGLAGATEVLGEGWAHYAGLARGGFIPGAEIGGWVAAWIWVPTLMLVSVVLLVFPAGRLRSARWRLVVGFAVAVATLGSVVIALTPGRLDNFPYLTNPFGLTALAGARNSLEPIVSAPLALTGSLAALAVVLRFRDARGEERQQLKWLAYAALHAAVVAVPSMLRIKAGEIGFIVAVTGIPIAIGAAILRYRLYEIDLIIRRTLVYGALSAILAVSYVAGVVILQAALGGLGGQDRLAVAGATLLIVGLFQPARARIQRAIDRRFYRSKYDAERTVAAFRARLREQVDLDDLRTELMAVVEQSLKPDRAWLWVRPGPPRSDLRAR